MRHPLDGQWAVFVTWPTVERFGDDVLSWNCGCPLQRTAHEHREFGLTADRGVAADVWADWTLALLDRKVPKGNGITIDAEAWGIDPHLIDEETGRVRQTLEDLLQASHAEYAESVRLTADSSEQDIQRIATAERAAWRAFRDSWCPYGVELVGAETALRHIRGELQGW